MNQQLDVTDRAIIKELGGDPRRSAAKIAQTIGVPESTVRHRLNQMVAKGLVEFGAVVNPLQLGFTAWVMIELQVELRKIESVGRRLAALPEVYFVGLTTGNYDIMIGAVFRSNDELAAFIIGPLANIPGILKTSTATVLKVIKRTSAFGLFETAFQNREQTTRIPKAKSRSRRSRNKAAEAKN